jgi:SlyX protein
MNHEDRLIAMESKLFAQEELVEVLNKTVYRQQKKIDELESLCIALARRLSDLHGRDGAGMAANERPPHY